MSTTNGTHKGFDQYLAEAKIEPFVLPMPTGAAITVQQPTLADMRKLQEARIKGDEEAGIFAILGERDGKRLVKLCEDKPAQVLNAIVTDVLGHFNLLVNLGDSSASLT